MLYSIYYKVFICAICVIWLGKILSEKVFQKKYSGVEGKGRGVTSTHLTVYVCNSVVAWIRRGAIWT